MITKVEMGKDGITLVEISRKETTYTLEQVISLSKEDGRTERTPPPEVMDILSHLINIHRCELIGSMVGYSLVLNNHGQFIAIETVNGYRLWAGAVYSSLRRLFDEGTLGISIYF